MEGEKWYIFSLFGSKMHTAGGSSGLKTNFISTSGFKTVMERAQSTSCRAAGWSGSWALFQGLGGALAAARRGRRGLLLSGARRQ